MSGYREKLTVAVKGHPLFGATVHHFEQARTQLGGVRQQHQPGKTRRGQADPGRAAFLADTPEAQSETWA